MQGEAPCRRDSSRHFTKSYIYSKILSGGTFTAVSADLHSKYVIMSCNYKAATYTFIIAIVKANKCQGNKILKLLVLFS